MDGRTLSILLVGPAADLSPIQAELSTAGLTARVASEADVQVLRHPEPPGLMIVEDAGEPGSLPDTLTRLRALPALSRVPIAVTSHRKDIESFSAAIANGASAYLSKPVQRADLLRLIRKLQDWHQSNTEPQQVRRHVRRPLVLDVALDLRDRHQQTAGLLLEVSEGGCRVDVSMAIENGERVSLDLRGPMGPIGIMLGAEVRWHRTNDEGGHAIGLKFKGTTAVLAAQLLGLPPSA